MIFEGEYLNGLRNGKGKSYEDNGRLEFEGEYLNGKKWNGKEIKSEDKTESKLEDNKEIKQEQYWNILFISVTLLVLKLDKFKEVKEEH